MGYIKHHAIIVTSWDDQQIDKAKKVADNIGLLVTNVVTDNINGYSTFLICPDGSKEGWPESETGDKMRNDFLDTIKAFSNIEWVEVSYSPDDAEAIISRSIFK